MSTINFDGLTNEEQKNLYTNANMEKMREDYEIYQKQRLERQKKRLEEEHARNVKKRAIAITTAVLLALGTGAYMIKDKLSNENSSLAEKPSVTYEDYIDYVNMQRDLGIQVEISEDGYNDFLEQHSHEVQVESKGSRK